MLVKVITACGKKCRLKQERIKMDKWGTYVECPVYNNKCNGTCNVKLFG